MYADSKQQALCLRLLGQSFLLQGVDNGVAETILAGSSQVLSFTKGQIIWGQGLHEDCLGLLLSGKAVAFSGGNASLRNFAKGDVFGAAAVYAPSAETVSRVQAQSSGEVLLLPLADIQRLICADSRVAENYIRFLAQRVAFLNRKIAAFTAGEATKRLTAHIAANAHKDEAGRTVLEANISKLAQSIGTSRASLYRAISQLTEEGILHREGRFIVVDKKPIND